MEWSGVYMICSARCNSTQSQRDRGSRGNYSHLADDEFVLDDSEVIIRHTLGGPDRTRTSVVWKDVKHPSLEPWLTTEQQREMQHT